MSFQLFHIIGSLSVAQALKSGAVAPVVVAAVVVAAEAKPEAGVAGEATTPSVVAVAVNEGDGCWCSAPTRDSKFNKNKSFRSSCDDY